MKDEFQIVFVVGASRSGTTMLNRILGQHSSITSLNELHYFGDVWNPYDREERWTLDAAIRKSAILIQRIRCDLFSGQPDNQSRSQAIQIANEILSVGRDAKIKPSYLYQYILNKYRQHENIKMVTDQTPRNIFYAEKLLELYPNSRVVHIVRDPRAVMFSQRKRWTKKMHGASDMPFSNVVRVLVNYHPITLSRMWKRAIQSGIGLSKHPRYYELRFESLVHDPQVEINKLTDYLGIRYEKQMMDVPQIGSSHNKHDQSRIGISSNYSSDWRGKLPKGDQFIVEIMLKRLMVKYGYQTISSISWLPWLILPIMRLPFHVMGVLVTNPKRAFILLSALVSKANTR